MGKFITAQDILKNLGIEKVKFDTEGFMNTVAKVFTDNPESEILLANVVFTSSMNGENLYEITYEDKRCGYKYEPFDTSPYVKKYGRDYASKSFDKWIDDTENKMYRKKIFIDTPFYKNAVALLEIMGGYTVAKPERGREKGMVVTLQ